MTERNLMRAELGSMAPETYELMRVVRSIPTEDVTRLCGALHVLAESIIEIDHGRAHGLRDAADLVRRLAKP